MSSSMSPGIGDGGYNMLPSTFDSAPASMQFGGMRGDPFEARAARQRAAMGRGAGFPMTSEDFGGRAPMMMAESPMMMDMDSGAAGMGGSYHGGGGGGGGGNPARAPEDMDVIPQVRVTPSPMMARVDPPSVIHPINTQFPLKRSPISAGPAYDDEEDEDISAPFGCWENIADPIIRSAEMRREIENRNNFFILPGEMNFTMANASTASWSVKKEWGDDMGSVPYDYSGSKFNGDRLIKAIYLRSAHNRGDVKHSLVFHLPNKERTLNRMAPVRKYLSPSHENGPVHLVLDAGEKAKLCFIPLWVKNPEILRSSVIQANPEVTKEELMSDLKECYADPMNKAILLPDAKLTHYIREQTDDTERAGDLDWIEQSGHYEIQKSIAHQHIKNWMREQALDLTIHNIWDITSQPGVCHSKEEIGSAIPLAYIGDKSGAKQKADDAYTMKNQHISFELQIELEPLPQGY